MNNEVGKKIKKLEDRVSALEAIAADAKGVNKNPKSKAEGNVNQEYSGPKGGILLLIQEGFLKTKRTADEVRITLEKKEYIYIIQVVQTALNRLSKPSGPLVKMEKEGKKVYVERK